MPYINLWYKILLSPIALSPRLYLKCENGTHRMRMWKLVSLSLRVHATTSAQLLPLLCIDGFSFLWKLLTSHITRAKRYSGIYYFPPNSKYFSSSVLADTSVPFHLLMFSLNGSTQFPLLRNWSMGSDFGEKARRKQRARDGGKYIQKGYLEKDEKGTSERNYRGLDGAHPWDRQYCLVFCATVQVWTQQGSLVYKCMTLHGTHIGWSAS